VSARSLRAPWLAVVEPVLLSATLRRPVDGWAPTGGRQGIHTEAFSYLVMELQVVHRAYPEGRW
jgi:ring-1,2-phenylacetyl-CoA epoxidase subunit PaaC